MQWIGYLLTRLVAEIFRFIPFRLLYGLSGALAFLLRAVMGYRTKVVYDNLRRAFPGKTEAELHRIARASYRNLADITLETLKSYTMPLAEIQRRCPPLNPELVNQYLDRGQSVILAGRHYGNWEFTGISMAPRFHGATIIAFKPLSNKLVDTYINQTRTRTGSVLIPMDNTFAVMRQRERDHQPSIYVLLSDQSPSSRKSAHWVDFLGRDTACLPGVDVLARKFNMPVLYYHVRRLRRGYYEIEYSEICANPAGAAETDITRAYSRHLENILRQQPENWLWSHKRWKMSR